MGNTDAEKVLEALKLLGIDTPDGLTQLESLEDLQARIGRVVPGASPIKPVELDTEYDLLYITCSKTKVEGEEGMPPILRYDGPKYKTLRKHLCILSGAEKDEPFNTRMIPDWLEIKCLSGWFGLLDAVEDLIPWYDDLGVVRRGLQASVIVKLKELMDERGPPGQVLVIGGLKSYGISFKNMDKFLKCHPSHIQIVSKGQGLQMRALIDWLRDRFREREGVTRW